MNNDETTQVASAIRQKAKEMQDLMNSLEGVEFDIHLRKYEIFGKETYNVIVEVDIKRVIKL